MKFSKTLNGIEPSGTFRFFALMKEMIQKGEDIIPLVTGELDSPTPKFIADAGKEAIDKGQTKYTINQGITELRQAISQKYKDDYNIEYDISEIIVSNGVKHAFFNCLFSIANRGNEVIVLKPYYPSYPAMVQLCGATPVIVDENINEIKNAVSTKTCAIILNSPSNPSGDVFSEDFLNQINNIVLDNDLWLLYDEIYEKIVYPPNKHISPLSLSKAMKERTLLVNGLSKSYAMTGWRIGYACGPKEIIDRAALVQSHTTSNANSIAQYAAITALKDGDKFIKSLLPGLISKRDYAVKRINDIQDLVVPSPQGAFYLFFDISPYIGKIHNGQVLGNSEAIAQYLLLEHKVALVPGSAFGNDKSLRLSFALEMKSLEKGLDKIKNGLEALL